MLGAVRSIALWVFIPAVTVAVIVTIALIRQEIRHADRANRAKWLYQASSLALIAAIVWDPLAGLAAYVAANAIEYIVVVERTMLKRYGGGVDRGSLLGRVARSTTSRVAVLVLVMGGFFAVNARLEAFGPRHFYDIVFYTMGMLLFWYDGFILKAPQAHRRGDVRIAPEAPGRGRPA